VTSNQPTSAEDRIVEATIECIEQYGIAGATNRRIAERAGVNIAAINYYFRSKEILIRRCLDITLRNAFDLGDMPAMPQATAEERCIAILIGLIEGGYRYPGLSRAHFYNLVAEGTYDPLLAKHLNHFIADLASDLRMRGSALPQDELKMALLQMLSVVILAILAPTLYAEQHGVNLSDPDTRRAYITRLVTSLLS
jgi:AcrR family transcriptional regulator